MFNPSFLLLSFIQPSVAPAQLPVAATYVEPEVTQEWRSLDDLTLQVSPPETSLMAALDTQPRLLERPAAEASNHVLAFNPAAPEATPAVMWSNQRNNAENTPILKPGSRGQAVNRLQQQLQQLGYNIGTVDGVYGALTKAAVIDFQATQGLTADGVVGAETWAKLQTPAPSPAVSAENNAAVLISDTTPQQTISSEVSAEDSAEDLWFWFLVILHAGGWGLVVKEFIKATYTPYQQG